MLDTDPGASVSLSYASKLNALMTYEGHLARALVHAKKLADMLGANATMPELAQDSRFLETSIKSEIRVCRATQAAYQYQLRLEVPWRSEIILSYFCNADRLETVLGDLERNFRRHAAKHGERSARRWYWWQTVRTIAAFALQTAAKVVLIEVLLKKLNL